MQLQLPLGTLMIQTFIPLWYLLGSHLMDNCWNTERGRTCSKTFQTELLYTDIKTTLTHK